MRADVELAAEMAVKTNSSAALPEGPNEATDAAFSRVKESMGEVAAFHRWLRFIADDIDALGCNVDEHWAPQSCSCGLESRLALYHVIPFQRMAEEAMKLHERIKKPTSERQREIGQFLTDRFKVMHDGSMKLTHAREKRDRFYTAELLDLVHDTYRRDYELFGAAFAAPASGEGEWSWVEAGASEKAAAAKAAMEALAAWKAGGWKGEVGRQRG
ncbi:unnamed protein product [Phaeothamnion confervicola]